MAGVGGPQSPLDMKPDTATLLNAAGFGPGSLGGPNSPGKALILDSFNVICIHDFIQKKMNAIFILLWIGKVNRNVI
jgi:hypothetical protein